MVNFGQVIADWEHPSQTQGGFEFSVRLQVVQEKAI